MNPTIDWPTSLPLPFVEYAGEPRNATLVSQQLRGGDEERRSRFTSSFVQVQAIWVFNETQLTAFRTFFTTTLYNGAHAFKIELRYPKNSALDEWAVRFLGDVTFDNDTNMWQVSAALDLIRKL